MANQTTEKQLTCLLIEDNVDFAALIKRELQSILFVEAKSYGEALSTLQTIKPDCIVMDLCLPDSPQRTTMANLPEICRHAPVIILTQAGDERISPQGIRLGAQDCLFKLEIVEGGFSKLQIAIMNAIERENRIKQIRQEMENLRQSADRLNTMVGEM